MTLSADVAACNLPRPLPKLAPRVDVRGSLPPSLLLAAAAPGARRGRRRRPGVLSLSAVVAACTLPRPPPMLAPRFDVRGSLPPDLTLPLTQPQEPAAAVGAVPAS